MAYKKGIEKIPEITKEALLEDKESIFLVQEKEESYRRITEKIAFVEKIERGTEGEISKLNLIFAGNIKVNTKAYIDSLVQENTFISAWGYFDEFKDKISFYCKGGCQRILSRLDEVEYIDVTYPYRMGIPELSKIEILPPYENTAEILQIEDTGIYYAKGNIEDMQTANENVNIIDTRVHKRFKAISFK